MSIKNNNFILAIPTKIKEAIDKQFPSYTNTDLVKIYFLVYKINKETPYQVHSKNHVWMLSLKNGAELKYILEGLKTLKIIYEGTVARIGYTSNTYKIVSKYDYKHESCFRINYYEGQTKFPIWVRKYVSDGGLVKGEEFSNYKKILSIDAKDLDTVVLDQKKTIEDMASQIKLLQAELASLKQSIPTGEVLPVLAIEDVIPKENGVKVAHVALQHEAPVKPKDQPFKAKEKKEVTDVFNFTYNEIDYEINNYSKLVSSASTEFHLQLGRKKMAHLPSSGKICIENNQLMITRTVAENKIIMYVN